MPRFKNIDELLTKMDSLSNRQVIVRIPYEYAWPLGGSGVLKNIVKRAEMVGLEVELRPEIGFWSRSGQLKVTGSESVMYAYMQDIAEWLQP